MALTIAELRAVFSADDRDYQQAVSRVKQSGGKMRSVGRDMTMFLTLPIAGIAAAAVHTEAQFGSTMAQLGVATGLSGKKLDAMRQLAIQTGKDTVFSANEAADAMLELAKGGMSAAQIKAGALKGAMALAATEGMGLADASTVIVNSLAQFGMQAKDATKVADALAAGSISSTASVSSLSQGLQQVGPSAKQAGLSLYDTIGALAELDSKGLKGADAGTSMKTMLMRLVPTTDKAASAMDALGLSFTKRNGEFKSFPAIVREMQKGLGGLSAADRSRAISVIFGTDAQRAVNLLIDGGVKGLKKSIKATKEHGAAQKLANARMSGTAGALERMKGSVETAALALGVALAPVVVTVAGWIGTLADGFSNLPGPMQTVIAVVGLAVAALGPMIWITGQLITALTVIAPILKIVTFNLRMLNLTMLSNPVFLVVAAIVALGIALVVAYKKSETFRKIVDATWRGIKAAAKAVFDWLAPKVMWVVDFVGKHWKLLVALLVGPLGVAALLIHKHWDKISGFFRAAWSWVKGFFKDHWKDAVLVAILGPLGLAIVLVRNNWDKIKGWFRSAWEWVKSVFRREWGIAKEMITAPVEAARDALQRILGPDGPIRSAFSRAVTGIKAIWGGLKDAALKPVAFVVNTVYNDGIRKVVNAIPGVPDLGVVKGFAVGGYTGQLGRNQVAGVVHGDEHVIRSSSRRRIESRHPGLLDEMNRTGLVPGYATGGRVSPLLIGRAQAFAASQVGKPYTLGGVGPGGYDCSGFMSAITNVLLGRTPFSRVGTTATFPWPGFSPGVGEFTIGSTPRYPGSSMGHMAGTLAGLNVESRGGTGVIVGSGARGFSDSGFTTIAHLGSSKFTVGSSHGGGNPFGPALSLLHDLNITDWVHKLAGMGGWGPLLGKMVGAVGGEFKDWATGRIKHGLGHGIGSVIAGATPAGFVASHLFDDGGWLAPGIPVNKTGKPEAVLTPEESAAFVAIAKRLAAGDDVFGGGPTITQTVTPTPTMDTEQLANAAADRILGALATMGGA